MLDVVNPKEDFSVQQYVLQAEKCIDEIFKKNKLPIIVGGTGLYIRSLIHPYSFCSSNKDDKIREHYNNVLKEKGKEYLYSLLNFSYVLSQLVLVANEIALTVQSFINRPNGLAL